MTFFGSRIKNTISLQQLNLTFKIIQITSQQLQKSLCHRLSARLFTTLQHVLHIQFTYTTQSLFACLWRVIRPQRAKQEVFKVKSV